MSNQIVLDGWTLRVDGGEPRVRDLDLGERAGLARPRDVRRAIRQAADDGAVAVVDNRADHRAELRDGPEAPDKPRAWLEREAIAIGSGAERDGEVYYLNEAAALVVLTRLRTRVAVQATQAIVKVFVAARRGELPRQAPAAEPPPAPPLMPDAAVRAAGRSIELALKTGKLTDEAASLKYAELAKKASGYDVTAPVEGMSWPAALPPAIAGLKPGQSAVITVPVDTTGLSSAESIGHAYGVSGQYVGKLARELGIFGKEGLGAWTEVRVNGVLKKHNWAYADDAVTQMAPHLEREAARRREAAEKKGAPRPKRLAGQVPLSVVPQPTAWPAGSQPGVASSVAQAATPAPAPGGKGAA
ncbi:MAG TPA: hypothetical protein VFS43_21635 [Polyangiaceae bacterium]|nr:hypothetical protein [Polyangiaceae bacterium]